MEGLPASFPHLKVSVSVEGRRSCSLYAGITMDSALLASEKMEGQGTCSSGRQNRPLSRPPTGHARLA